jgi:hypothetical protein
VLIIASDESSGMYKIMVLAPDGSVDETMTGTLKIDFDNVVGIHKPDDNADVTEDAIDGASAKASLVADDSFAIIDSEDSTSPLKRITWTNLKSVIAGAVITLTNKTIGLLNNTLKLETLSSDHTACGIYDYVTVDANATGFGAALYCAADGHYEEANAGAAGTMRCSAIAIDTGTGSSKKVLTWGKIRDDSWTWTPGGLVFVSTTNGTLTQTAPSGSGEFIQCVGEAKASNIILFDPSYDAIKHV